MSFWEITRYLAEGFSVTLALFLLTLIIALPLGFVFAFASMSRFKPLSYLSRGFVYIIRGTPLLLQLLLVDNFTGIVFGPAYAIARWPMFGPIADFLNGIGIEKIGMIDVSSVAVAHFFGALIAFSVNYACYFSEIYRGGIQNLPKGQKEAGLVLGMTQRQIFFKVTFIQMVKQILTPMSNEIITLVKDTALATTVTVAEIYYQAGYILNNYFIIWPLFYSGAFYLAFSALLTFLFNRAEKKLSYIRV